MNGRSWNRPTLLLLLLVVVLAIKRWK